MHGRILAIGDIHGCDVALKTLLEGLWLTCLDVENELVWQSSEAGELRGPFPLREIATPFRLL